MTTVYHTEHLLLCKPTTHHNGCDTGSSATAETCDIPVDCFRRLFFAKILVVSTVKYIGANHVTEAVVIC